MTSILLIRHGQTDAINRVLSGRTPRVHLNDVGRAQTLKLAGYVKSQYTLSGIISSPLERAVETAQPLADMHGLPLSINNGFTEFDFGEWTGLTLDELHAKPEWAEYNRYRSLHSAPGGECIADVQRRAWLETQKVAREFDNTTVAVISHADVIRALLMLVLGMPLDNILRLTVPLASVSELVVGAGRGPVVSRVGLTVPEPLQ